VAGLGGDRASGPLAALVIAAGQHQARSLAGQLVRRGQPDPRAGPGQQDQLAADSFGGHGRV
jgi:hypothetical protein